MGKTTLANTLFNETATPPSYGQQQRALRPRAISRVAAGFTLTVIDTPGLPEDGANVDLVGQLWPLRVVIFGNTEFLALTCWLHD